MSFFAAPPPPPPPPPERHRSPAWWGPPANVLPGAATFAVLLVNTGAVALAVIGGLAGDDGLEFSVHVRRRPQAGGRRSRLLLDPSFDPMGAWDDDGRLRDEVLRFGVAFADGQRATTLPHWHGPGDPDQPPKGPVLTSRGGGGSDDAWTGDLWLWPLPPPGPLAFVCAWPSEGITETRAEIDATPLLAAAQRAVVLWPDDDGDNGGLRGHSGMTHLR